MKRRDFLISTIATAAAAQAHAFFGLFEKETPKISYDFQTIPNTTPFPKYHGYANAYEFGTDKSDPRRYEHLMKIEGWTVDVGGTIVDIDQLRGMPFNELDDKIFNLRCVEGWAMRVHYNGLPLSTILKKYCDTSKKYVAFTSVEQDQLPGQQRHVLNWPYQEALTMEEAMHPLCWAVFGNYGVEAVANGAPLRINVPWKYGFKSPKYVVKIETTDIRPVATWNRENRREYGWYSNVYPEYAHPRWSQASHRFIGTGRTVQEPTLPYNGYEAEVAHLYPGDTRQYF